MRDLCYNCLQRWGGIIVLLAFLGGTAAFAQVPTSGTDLTSLSLEDLSHVQVFTASRHVEYSEEAPSSVTIITAEEIARYGWRTLGEVLRSVRGFYTAYDRDYTYLGVRGFLRSGDYNGRILLMINGHRLNDRIYDSAHLGSEFPLDLDLIERIEIVRGPSSSMFGTNALFGVINVITRRVAAHRQLEVSGDASSFYGRTGRVTAGLQHDSRSLLVSASMYRSNGQESLFYPDFADPSTNNGYAIDADGDRYGHAFADAQLGNFRLQALASERIKLLPTAAYATVFNDPRTRSKDGRVYVDLGYQRSLSAKTDVDLHAYYDSALSLGTGAFGAANSVESFMGYTRGRADWIGTDLNLSHSLGRHRIMFGAEYDYCIRVDQSTYTSLGDTIFKDHRTPHQAATYSQTDLKLSSRIMLNAGVRVDWSDSMDLQLSPRIATIFKLDSKTSLKYIFGHSFRAPNAYETYFVDSVVISRAATPRLSPEDVESHEIVFDRSLLPWLHFTSDAYYNALEKLIDQVPNQENGLTQFVNAGRDTGRGLEFEVEAKRPSGLAARASYTLADARDNESSRRLVSSPLHLAKLNAILPIRRKSFAAVELLYASPQTSYRGSEVPSSLLTNLTISTKPLRSNWQFSASCYNLFDQKWYAPAGGELRQATILQDGRTFRIKLTYVFLSGEARSKP